MTDLQNLCPKRFWFGMIYDAPWSRNNFIPLWCETEEEAKVKVKGIFPKAFNIRVKYPS